MQWLTTIAGQHVAFTGKAWRTRREIQRTVRRLGGIPTPNGDVTTATTVLVKGESSRWAYGDHGRKEKRTAQLIAQGQLISLVYDFEFRKLLESGRRAKVSDSVAGQPVDWLTAPTKQQFKKAAAIDGPLDREYSVKGRVEQSYLRRCLFGDAEEGDCSLCGRRLPLSLLVAAHIKPRSECSRRERLDVPNIVFTVCVLGCDALYERGLIGVGSAGRIRVAAETESRLVKKVLAHYRGRKCSAWNQGDSQYFEWHLTRRFQG